MSLSVGFSHVTLHRFLSQCAAMICAGAAGAGFALSLVLNIEQYEYMSGPQDEAGIKMLLHDASDTPLVKELGFAIAPGTHTLVGVNMEVVSIITHTHSPSHTHTPSHTHSPSHTLTLAHILLHMHTRTHAHTHTKGGIRMYGRKQKSVIHTYTHFLQIHPSAFLPNTHPLGLA